MFHYKQMKEPNCQKILHALTSIHEVSKMSNRMTFFYKIQSNNTRYGQLVRHNMKVINPKNKMNDFMR